MEPSVEEVLPQIIFCTEGLDVIAYRAMLDVSRDVVRFVGRLLYARGNAVRIGVGVGSTDGAATIGATISGRSAAPHAAVAATTTVARTKRNPLAATSRE